MTNEKITMNDLTVANQHRMLKIAINATEKVQPVDESVLDREELGKALVFKTSAIAKELISACERDDALTLLRDDVRAYMNTSIRYFLSKQVNLENIEKRLGCEDVDELAIKLLLNFLTKQASSLVSHLTAKISKTAKVESKTEKIEVAQDLVQSEVNTALKANSHRERANLLRVSPNSVISMLIGMITKAFEESKDVDSFIKAIYANATKILKNSSKLEVKKIMEYLVQERTWMKFRYNKNTPHSTVLGTACLSFLKTEFERLTAENYGMLRCAITYVEYVEISMQNHEKDEIPADCTQDFVEISEGDALLKECVAQDMELMSEKIPQYIDLHVEKPYQPVKELSAGQLLAFQVKAMEHVINDCATKPSSNYIKATLFGTFPKSWNYIQFPRTSNDQVTRFLIDSVATLGNDTLYRVCRVEKIDAWTDRVALMDLNGVLTVHTIRNTELKAHSLSKQSTVTILKKTK